MSAYFGTARETVFRLTLSGSPATAIIFSAPVVKIRKANATAFTTKTLVVTDWVDLGAGYYALKWSAGDMNVLGAFLYEISGAGFDTIYGSFDVDPAPVAFSVSPPYCIVSGNIVDIGGDPMRLEQIVFRPQYVPAVTGPSLIAAGVIRTATDALGNFSVALIRGTKALVEIERAGIKYLIEIPEQPSATLLSLLPPIT